MNSEVQKDGSRGVEGVSTYKVFPELSPGCPVLYQKMDLVQVTSKSISLFDVYAERFVALNLPKNVPIFIQNCTLR